MASSYDYEQQVLSQLRHDLLEHNPEIGQGNKRITVEDVYLELDRSGDHMVVILFREAGRQQCVFGFRALACEPSPQLTSDGQWGEIEDPQGWASVILANLREHIEASDMGLPADYNAGGITWMT